MTIVEFRGVVLHDLRDRIEKILYICSTLCSNGNGINFNEINVMNE